MVKTYAEVKIPEGVQLEIADFKITAKGKEGELSRELPKYNILFKKEDDKIIISIEKSKYRNLVGAWKSHINNLINGVQKQYTYRLKICSSHFPMSVKLHGSEIQVQNFLGEKCARKMELPGGAKVDIKGDIIEVKSMDKELAGRIAGRIEALTRLSGKDKRVFMDMIVMTHKAGRLIQ